VGAIKAFEFLNRALELLNRALGSGFPSLHRWRCRILARLIFGIHAKKHTDEGKDRPNKEHSQRSDF